jgi:signal recognition particle subunit SRP54
MGQTDPVKIAVESIDHANKNGNDVVMLDTAGRLHIDETLMNELKNIKAKVQPHEIMLVVDAMTGQDAVNAAKAFDDALGIDSIFLTKLDGDARGGAALSVRPLPASPLSMSVSVKSLTGLSPSIRTGWPQESWVWAIYSPL